MALSPCSGETFDELADAIRKAVALSRAAHHAGLESRDGLYLFEEALSALEAGEKALDASLAEGAAS